MRNPRRAYNRDGTMIQPETVGNHAANGLHRVQIYCHTCGHSKAGIDVSHLPPETAIPDICLRYRCSQCGGKNLMSRGCSNEFYARFEAGGKKKDASA